MIYPPLSAICRRIKLHKGTSKEEIHEYVKSKNWFICVFELKYSILVFGWSFCPHVFLKTGWSNKSTIHNLRKAHMNGTYDSSLFKEYENFRGNLQHEPSQYLTMNRYFVIFFKIFDVKLSFLFSLKFIWHKFQTGFCITLEDRIGKENCRGML